MGNIDENEEKQQDNNKNETETVPLALNHVGLTVTDIDAALQWYNDVMGFMVLSPPISIPEGSGHFSDILNDLVGGFEEAKMAQMEAADGTGFELFEYTTSKEKDDARNPEKVENWQAAIGIHHISVTHPDVESVIKKIEDEGGRQYSDVWNLSPDNEYKFVYVQDPWGNFIEICNRSYAQLFANQ